MVCQDVNETEYEFTAENPYLGKADAMQQAEKLMTEGELLQATLALEAVVQAEPKNSRAWFLLGELQAECDFDNKAIAALKRYDRNGSSDWVPFRDRRGRSESILCR